MPAAVPTDEIYERYLKRAIAEINELGDEIALKSIFAVVRAAVDRGGAVGVRRLTGHWPE